MPLRQIFILLCLFGLTLACHPQKQRDVELAQKRAATANQLRQEGKYTDGLLYLDHQTIAQLPKDEQVRARINRATMLLELERPAEAFDELPPSPPNGEGNWQVEFLRGVASYRLGHYQAAISALDRASELNANERSIVLNKGVVHEYYGNYELACLAYSRGLDLNPGQQSDRIYASRGDLYFELGNYRAALIDFQHAISSNAAQSSLLANAAAAAFYLGDSAQALQYLNSLSNHEADDEAHREARLGKFYSDVYEYELAQQHLRRAISHNPSNGYYRTSFATVAYLAGTIELATSELQEAIRTGAETPNTHKTLALIALKQARYSEAEAQFRKALQAKRTDIVANIGLSALAVLTTQDSHHCDELETALTEQPNLVELWLWYQLLGGKKAASASAYVNQCSPQKWPNPLAKYFLKQMTFEGAFQATRHPNKAIQRERRCEFYFYSGALAYQQGNTESALKLWDTAVESQAKATVTRTLAEVFRGHLMRPQSARGMKKDERPFQPTNGLQAP